MLGILIKKELLDNLYSLRFHISSVIVVLLMLISVLVLKQDYEARMATYMENQRAYLEAVQEKDSYFFLMFSGIGVDRPPAHLSIFYNGVEKNPNRKSTIFPFFKPEFTGELNINPVFPLFPAVDLVFVVSIVMGLLAFVFTYNSITGEREMGTLKLLMSYSVPRDKVILAKWIGGYISLVIPFIAGVIVCSLVVVLSPKLQFTGLDWGAFFLTVLVSLLFIGVMYSVGLFVSIISRTSATSISILLLIWVVFVLIIPNVSPFIVDQIKPIRSVSEVMSQIKYKSGDTINNMINDVIGGFEEAVGISLEDVEIEGADEEGRPPEEYESQSTASSRSTTSTTSQPSASAGAEMPEGVDMGMVSQVLGEITDEDLREIQLLGCESYLDTKLKEKVGMGLEQIKSMYPDAARAVDECKARKDELAKIKKQAEDQLAGAQAQKAPQAAPQPKQKKKVSMQETVTAFMEQPEDVKGKFYDTIFDSIIKANKDNSLISSQEMEAYDREVRSQVALTKLVSRLSPVSSFIYAVTDLANTGIEREWHLKESLWGYQNHFREFLEKKFSLPDSERTHPVFGGFFREPEYNMDDLPRFKYNPMPLNERISHVFTDIFLLFAFAVLFFMAAFIAFLRADIID
ncbi:MAG: ABC transporter permease subunit [bacterium]